MNICWSQWKPRFCKIYSRRKSTFKKFDHSLYVYVTVMDIKRIYLATDFMHVFGMSNYQLGSDDVSWRTTAKVETTEGKLLRLLMERWNKWGAILYKSTDSLPASCYFSLLSSSSWIMCISDVSFTLKQHNCSSVPDTCIFCGKVHKTLVTCLKPSGLLTCIFSAVSIIFAVT